MKANDKLNFDLKKRKNMIMLFIIMSTYFLLRFRLLFIQNAYFDYDEGTYLLIARLINHGILPYRDILAVHPPLYYYALAWWLRLFGDSYLTGRIFSLFLGLLSVFLAYFTGRELKNEKLGLAFALLIAIDPLAVKVNTLVLHESMIEFFTLLSLLFFVRYIKNRKRKDAYLTLIFASMGTSAKFTLIPYLIAVFVFLILYEFNTTRSLLLSSARKITKRQEYIIPLTYLIWTMASMAAVVLYPHEVTRIIASVPGIHPITKLGHVYTCMLFLFLWVLLTVYLLNIKYIQYLKNVLKKSREVAMYGLTLTLIIIISKAIVEVPLGILISSNYLNQTYLAQDRRGYPFVGLFWIIGKAILYIQDSSLELLAYYAPLLVLVSIILVIKATGRDIEFSKPLKAFVILNTIFYLLLIPMIPDPRFIYPLLLTLYLYLLHGLINVNNLGKKIVGVSLVLILLLTAVNLGIERNYPLGLLKIPCASHSKDLRDDLSNYIKEEHLLGTYLSINPMDAYYTNLSVVPYLVDTFGLGYLRGYNLVNLTLKYNPNYIIYDTWMFSMMKAKPMYRVYAPIFNYTLQNGTLLFGESLNDGEVIMLFNLDRSPYTWKLETQNAELWIHYLDDVLKIRFKVKNSTAKKLIIKKINTTYIISITINTKQYHGKIVLENNSVTITMPKTTIAISFNGVLLKGGLPVETGTFNSLELCTKKRCITFKGNLTVKRGSLYAKDGILIKAPTS